VFRVAGRQLPQSLPFALNAFAVSVALVALVQAIRVALVRCPRCEGRFYISPVRLFLGINLFWYSRCAHCGLDLAHVREHKGAI
jgi:hypothetical protein